MIQKEIAWVRGSTRTQAEETGAASRQATTSNTNYTTTTAKSQSGTTRMTNSVFDEVRRLVSAQQAAEYYGFAPNRSNFIPCPFHDGDRTASLKLYPGTGGFYCFACHAGGSVVDFVAQLYGLDPLDAVRRLNTDFHLALPLDQPPSKAQQEAVKQRQKLQVISNAFERWRDDLINQLNEAYRIGHTVLLNWPDTLAEQEILAVKWHDTLEYWSDILMFGSMDEQMNILRDKEGIEKLCQKILKNTQMKYSAA